MTALRNLHGVAIFTAVLALTAILYGAPRIAAALAVIVVVILVVSLEVLRANIRRLETRP